MSGTPTIEPTQPRARECTPGCKHPACANTVASQDRDALNALRSDYARVVDERDHLRERVTELQAKGTEQIMAIRDLRALTRILAEKLNLSNAQIHQILEDGDLDACTLEGSS